MIRLSVQVRPGASRDAIELLDDDTLDVRVRARAVGGAANQALLRLLATRLLLRGRQVRIVRGERTRLKLVEVELPTMTELRARFMTKA